MDLTRRRFFQALAASALAAGVPLPIGMPLRAAEPVYQYETMVPWIPQTMLAMMQWALVTPDVKWFTLSGPPRAGFSVPFRG